jgi:glycosyltransferase involved in cell wall biosynthesis
VVTEAASQGTPAVVYDVDGLRDAVHNNESGMIVSENTPSVLAETIVDLLSDDVHYHALQKAGWEWSREITFDKGYQQFISVLTN